VGLAGLAATWGVDANVAPGQHAVLFGFTPCPFAMNPFHSLVHLAAGVVLLAGTTRGDLVSRSVNRACAATYLALAVVAPGLGATGGHVFALHDTFAYLGIGAAALALAHVAARATPATSGAFPALAASGAAGGDASSSVPPAG
jgi:hypothetical protein